MPTRPLVAHWEPPRPNRKPGEPPAPVVEITERTGRVWQAEEVGEDGRWRRRFGVVLPHGLARIPAEEINLIDAFEVAAAGVRGRDTADLVPPNAVPLPKNRPEEPTPFAWETSVVAPIRLRNPTGLDLPVPAELFRREGGRVVGMNRRLQLALTLEPPRPRDEHGRLSFDRWAGQAVPLRPELVRFDPEGPTRTLGPAGSLATVAVDLRDLFSIDRPGRYTLRVGYPSPEIRLPGGAVIQNPGADSQPLGFVVVGPPIDPP